MAPARGSRPTRTARTVVHTVDAQVHRVHLWYPVTTDSLLALVRTLAPLSSAN
ncbi:hypothetical protein ACWEKT_33385 [Nocardia takedensis]